MVHEGNTFEDRFWARAVKMRNKVFKYVGIAFLLWSLYEIYQYGWSGYWMMCKERLAFIWFFVDDPESVGLMNLLFSDLYEIFHVAPQNEKYFVLLFCVGCVSLYFAEWRLEWFHDYKKKVANGEYIPYSKRTAKWETPASNDGGVYNERRKNSPCDDNKNIVIDANVIEIKDEKEVPTKKLTLARPIAPRPNPNRPLSAAEIRQSLFAPKPTKIETPAKAEKTAKAEETQTPGGFYPDDDCIPFPEWLNHTPFFDKLEQRIKEAKSSEISEGSAEWYESDNHESGAKSAAETASESKN